MTQPDPLPRREKRALLASKDVAALISITSDAQEALAIVQSNLYELQESMTTKFSEWERAYHERQGLRKENRRLTLLVRELRRERRKGRPPKAVPDGGDPEESPFQSCRAVGADGEGDCGPGI